MKMKSKRSFELLKIGADAIYCPQSAKLIKAITDEGIPVVGHSGFIPYKSTLYGGFSMEKQLAKKFMINVYA